VLRLDLAPIYHALLWIAKKTGAHWRPETLPWLANPGEKSWDDAKKLLRLLGFTTAADELTDPKAPLLPVHPRVARFAQALVEGGYDSEAPWLTAILASPDDVPTHAGDNTHLGCDLLARYETLRAGRQTFQSVSRAAQQISRLLKNITLPPIETCKPAHEMDLSSALLQAFPDRVMLIRNRGNKSHWMDGTLCTGGDLRLSRDSAAAHGEWVVALDASSTRVTGSVAAMTKSQGASSSQVTVTMASQIDARQLTDSPSELLVTEDIREWDEKAGKSRLFRKTTYGVLQLSSTLLRDEDAAQSPLAVDGTSHLLQQLSKTWPKPFDTSYDFDSYLVRQKLAFDSKLTDHIWNRDELFELLLSQICDEAKSFGEIAAKPLLEWIRHCVGEDEFSHLNKVAPLSITVGAGHKVKVHYSETSPPWIEARLQNFFGQASTPNIMDGRLPLTLHLLSPNMRALQVTTDLAGFWQRVYPSLRNEYQRKYPRHYWPENPMAAEPPPMRAPRKPR
jgi:ATP-dependent helicase HrpB